MSRSFAILHTYGHVLVPVESAVDTGWGKCFLKPNGKRFFKRRKAKLERRNAKCEAWDTLGQYELDLIEEQEEEEEAAFEEEYAQMMLEDLYRDWVEEETGYDDCEDWYYYEPDRFCPCCGQDLP